MCPTWEQWAEIRRLHFIDKVGIRELARRFGVQRKTIRRAIRSADPPKYSRPRRPSKLDPFTDEIHRQLNDDPRLPVRSLGAGTLDPGRIRPNAPRVRRHLHALLVATASIAKAASVDPATVVRTSRRLGFEGFESLKLAAARASGAKTPVPVADDGPALTEEAALVRRSMLGDAQHVNADVIGLDRSGWQVELATEDCNDEGVAAYEAPHVERLRRFCALDALVEWPNFHGGFDRCPRVPCTPLACTDVDGALRLSAGALIFSKEAPDILAGLLLRCLVRIGRLSRKLVWDREGALHAGGGRPTEAFASFLGQLALGWISLAPRDPKAKGIEERGHRFLRTSFEPAHLFAGPGDFQEQFDDWYEGRANIRFHRGIRARPVEERLTAARAARHGAGQKIDDPMSPVSRGIRADGPWRSARAATTSCRIFLNA